MSNVDPGRAATITWTWRVPEDARDESWDGSVACWRLAGDVGRERADIERSFEVAVDGARDGALEIIEPDTLTVELSPDDETDARPSLERWADMAQLGTLLATALGLLAVRRQISLARSHSRSERTGQVFDRLNNAEFKALWSKVLTFLHVGGEAECVERIRQEVRVATGNEPLLRGEHKVVLNDVLAAHDAHEEAGLLFNDRTIDQRTVIRAFGESVANAYVDSWWWIQYQREARGDPAPARWVGKRKAIVYAEWERMVSTMLAHSPVPRADRDEEWQGTTVRAICLPGRDGATPAEWREAGVLSAAVGRVLRRPQGAGDLEDFLKAQDPGRDLPEPFVPVHRTILIPPWPDLLTLPTRSRRVAAAVGAWWDRRWEKHGGSSTGFRLARLDPRLSTADHYQKLAWRLQECRRRLTDADLLLRLRTAFPPDA